MLHTKHPLFLVLFSFITTICYSQPAILWDKTFSGKPVTELNDYSNQYTRIVKTLNDDLIIVASSIDGKGYEKTDSSFGKRDFWVIKMNKDGNKLWDKTLGTEKIDLFFRGVCALSNGDILVGGSTRTLDLSQVDGLLYKLDANGKIKWNKIIGGNQSDRIVDILEINANEYWVLLYSPSDANGEWKTEDNRGPGDDVADYWLVSIDSSGNKLWDKTLGGEGGDYPSSLLKVNPNLYLLGGSSFSFKSFDKSEDYRGVYDYWIVAVDSLGNKLWDKTIGGNKWDRLTNMSLLSDGIILYGDSPSDMGFDKSEPALGTDIYTDIWVVKIDFNGNKLWDKTIGGTSREWSGESIVYNDTIYLIVSSDSEKSFYKSEGTKNGFGLNYWIVALDKHGNKLWDKTIGSWGERVPSICKTSNTEMFIMGLSNSPVYGDKTTIARGAWDFNNEPSDFWVVKLVNGPTIREIKAEANCNNPKLDFWVDGNAPFTIYIDNEEIGSFNEKNFSINTNKTGNLEIKIKDRDGKIITQQHQIETKNTKLKFLIASEKSGVQPNGGVILMNGFGGMEPYRYQLDNGAIQDNGVFLNLNSGTYIGKIIDATDCEVTRTIVIQ